MTHRSGSGPHRLGAEERASFGVEEVRGCVVVRAAGELDLATTPGLRDAVQVAAEFSSLIIVDLTLVTMLDSTGLSVLVEVQAQEHASDGVVALVASRHSQSVLELTALVQRFPIYEQLAQAVDALADTPPTAAP